MGTPLTVSGAELTRAALSRELLTRLQEEQQHSWRDIVTLDESRFYLNTDHRIIQLQPDESVPD
jgi:hypothetical protein